MSGRPLRWNAAKVLTSLPDAPYWTECMHDFLGDRKTRAPNMSSVRAIFLAAFLLCSPDANWARPADARMRRSVTHAQLMHDKGRTLQDFKRRMWLQELLDEVHTAEIRQLPLPEAGPAILPPFSKAPAPSKSLPADWSAEEREATNLPQETDKSFKDGKRRKKGRPGRRKDGDKRKRRARSPAGRWVLRL
ncbi:parathyroid hormone-like hormone a isoform X2 [Vanacampus margaritifer]